MNDHVSLIENKDPKSTDLLQEYFIPEKDFNQYLKDIKPVLLQSKLDLLNITIRAVNKDEDTFMNYARKMFLVLSFFSIRKKRRKKKAK